MKPLTKKVRAGLTLESLEDRLALSVSYSSLSAGVLTMWSNNSASNVTVTQSGGNTILRDTTNGFYRSVAGVAKVQFVGGSANDRFINYVPALPVVAWGQGGNDFLEGYNGADTLFGGDGDDTLRGYGGNDQLLGGAGRDTLQGMAGKDYLYGGDGNDYLNGGVGDGQADILWGQLGADTFRYDGSGSNLDSPRDFSAAQWDTLHGAPASLGSRVVQFAAARLGQFVGPIGECTDLVNAALQSVGAKTTSDFGVSGPGADYVWGDLVATYRPGDAVSALANVQPGDIIQFRNVNTRETFPDGSWATRSYPHHTAIVEANLGGGRFTVLEQNVSSGGGPLEKWVHRNALNLSAMTGGVVWIYRPVAK